MVDGETVVMAMAMISPSIPVPEGCRNRNFWSPELGFEVAAALCIFSGKTIGGSGVFRSKGVNRRKGRRQPCHHLARWDPGAACPGPRPGGIWGCGWPPQPPSGSVGLLQKYNFWNFSRFLRDFDFCTKIRHQCNSAENSVSLC